MISGKTSLVGLLGKPVRHSLSPVIQNAAIKEMGLDWCYLAMPCEAQNLESIAKALLQINCQGLNITIPHKQNALKICSQISPLAKRLGAINTLVANKEGGWRGLNTDVEGFLAPLQEKKWTKKKAVILGCGGSARAVIAGLQSLKMGQVTVVGRREDALNNFLMDFTAKELKSNEEPTSLKGLLKESKELVPHINEADLIVNTTPVGMYSKDASNIQTHEIPLGKKIWQYLRPQTILYDLIYTPKPTAWLSLGAKIGCEQIDGLEMLIQQGAASLRVWSNNEQVPITIMREAARKHLAA